MSILSTMPEVVDIEHYGGDTLNITVNIPWSLAEGKTWTAQVRSAKTPTAAVDATFTCTAPTGEGAMGTLVLPASETQRLALELGSLVQVRGSRSSDPVTLIQRYVGVWDVQIAAGGSVRTLAQGSLTIDLDVTRSV